MDDLISRKDAIDAVGRMLRRKFGIGGNLAEITLAGLPSAQPETDGFCTDCKEYDQERHFCPRFDRVIKKTLDEMQFTHCKDCRYSEYDALYGDRYCHYDGKADIVADEHYCGYAERREE